MSDFMTMLQSENNKAKTFTENGAVAYETSGKFILDFNFKLTQYRNMDVAEIKNDFTKVYYENPLIATKFVFYVGDIRGGLGERKVFNSCIEWLADNKPEIALRILETIPEYTRWDNLIRLIPHKAVGDEALSIVRHQLRADWNNMKCNKPISLCAKWMPSNNASSVETKALARYICRKINATPKAYRKTLSRLRKYLNVVEVKMSSNDWGSIDYTAVPSQANMKYNDAFLRNDEDRRRRYLNSLQKGETKINASVAQPHEIVRKYLKDCWLTVNEYDITLEEMWKALPNIATTDTLVVRDGSGSMLNPIDRYETTCLDVATALTIYCTEHNSPKWENKFITFSRNPKVVDISNCKTLRDKLVKCCSEDDCSNTDIEKTMRLILETAIANNCTQDEMPKNIAIISDMQFDGTTSESRYSGMNWNETLFESISKEYEEYGYKLPRLIFWNVCDRNHSTIPMQKNELGLVLCSGFSTNNMKMFMSGEINPYKVLLEQIDSPRYDNIEKLIKDII